MKHYSFILFLTILLTIYITSGAIAFRCENKIIKCQDIAISAQEKCGDPIQYSWGYENIKGNMKYVEKQFFNCGENDFIYSISIYNGIIVKIDEISRGNGKGQCQ